MAWWRQVEVHKAKASENTRDGYNRHLVESPLLPETARRTWDREALRAGGAAFTDTLAAVEAEDEPADVEDEALPSTGDAAAASALGMTGGAGMGMGLGLGLPLAMGLGGMDGEGAPNLDRLGARQGARFLMDTAQMMGLDVTEEGCKAAVRYHRNHVRWPSQRRWLLQLRPASHTCAVPGQMPGEPIQAALYWMLENSTGLSFMERVREEAEERKQRALDTPPAPMPSGPHNTRACAGLGWVVTHAWGRSRAWGWCAACCRCERRNSRAAAQAVRLCQCPPPARSGGCRAR